MVVSPRGQRARQRLALTWLSIVCIATGIGLFITLGTVVARDHAQRERIAERQTHKPVEIGSGVPIIPSAIPIAPALTPLPSATAAPSATNWDETLVPPTDLSLPEATLPVHPAPAPTATAAATPTPTPTPAPDMPPATHISIAAVGVDADIVEITPEIFEVDGRQVINWPVADYAAGHHATSADPGEGGNIVLAGHDDYHGEVFRGLHDIQAGDQITLTTPAGSFTYIVTEIYIRQYRDAPLAEQIAIGVWMDPMPEERLTLITCWPYGVDDHRVIVVAKPAPIGAGG